MAIQTTAVGTANTTLYTSAGNSAITFLSFCNYSAQNVTVRLYIVPSTDSPSNDNLFIKDIEIVAGDTFVAYEGGEKIVLGDGDFIVAFSDFATSVSAITSYVNI